MANDEVKIILTAVDKASPALKGVSKSIKGVEDQAKGSSKTLGGLASSLASLSPVSLTAGGAILALGGFIKSSIDEAMRADRVMQQTEAVVRTTGEAAGYSALEVQKLAEAESQLTGISDETVQSGINMLLTFTNIGQDALPLATRAMENMAVAMAGGDLSMVDLKGTAIQLGKALNDPVLGVQALREVGVAFNDETRTTINNLVKENKLFEAQQIILEELATEFGGAAEAAGQSFSGELAKLNNEWNEFKEGVGLPIIVTIVGIFEGAKAEEELFKLEAEAREVGVKFLQWDPVIDTRSAGQALKELQVKMDAFYTQQRGTRDSWVITNIGSQKEFDDTNAFMRGFAYNQGQIHDAQYTLNESISETNDELTAMWTTEQYITGELYDGVSAMDAQVVSAQAVRGAIESAKQASLEFVGSLSGVDIGNPISSFIEDMKWFLANGTYFEDELERIKSAALTDPQGAAESAKVLLGQWWIAKQEFEGKTWNLSQFAKAMGISIEQAGTLLQAIFNKQYELNYNLIIHGEYPKDLWLTAHYTIDIYNPGNQYTPGDKHDKPRQMGGPVYAGQQYLVGEAGPELFVPNMGGRIVPNNQITVNGGVNMNVQQGMNGKALFDEFVNELSRQTRNASTSGMLTAGRVG